MDLCEERSQSLYVPQSPASIIVMGLAHTHLIKYSFPFSLVGNNTLVFHILSLLFVYSKRLIWLSEGLLRITQVEVFNDLFNFFDLFNFLGVE